MQGRARHLIAPPWPTWLLKSEWKRKNLERSGGGMRESPDRLTERVLQMLAAARTSSMSREEATEQMALALRWNLSYLARRKARGTTPVIMDSLGCDLGLNGRLCCWSRLQPQCTTCAKGAVCAMAALLILGQILLFETSQESFS